MEFTLVIAVIAAIFVIRGLKNVPPQYAWDVERFGKPHRTLTPGWNFVVPFIDRVADKHLLKDAANVPTESP